MNDFLHNTTASFSTASAEASPFMEFDYELPLVKLVAAGFLMAAILLAPALAAAVWNGCRGLFRIAPGTRP
jgi:hypothetical protein